MNTPPLTFAEMRRQIERAQRLMLLSMAVLLSVASCSRALTATQDKEHQVPVTSQKGGQHE